MFFDNPMLFDQAIQELLPHLAHRITITHYGGDAAPDSVAIECQDCHELLIDFVPEPSASERPDPEQVRYEATTMPTEMSAASRSSSPANRPIQCRSARTSSTIPQPESHGDMEEAAQLNALWPGIALEGFQVQSTRSGD